MALVVTSVSAATDYIDLLGDITIEDELAQAVELREARSRVVMPEDSVWETIRKGFALNDLPETVVDAELRARMYLYFIVSETQRRGMPTEIAL